MTFIYARKFHDLVYLFADTFSRNSVSQIDPCRFTNPMFKIVRLNQHTVVAFAGNAETARRQFRTLLKASFSNTKQSLLEIRRKYIYDKDRYVEFALSEISEKSLYFIKNGELTDTSASYLGEKAAFEIFQASEPHIADSTATNFRITLMPGGVSRLAEHSEKHFSDDLQRFKSTLAASNVDFGGICIGYTNSDHRIGYLCDTDVQRGALVESEWKGRKKFPTRFQDTIGGEFIVSQGGDASSITIFYPTVSIAVFYDSENAGQSAYGSVKKFADPYEFDFFCQEHRLQTVASTWRSEDNDLWKIHQLISAKRLPEAKRLLTSIFGYTVHLIKKSAYIEVGVADLESGILPYLKKAGSIKLSIQDINFFHSSAEVAKKYYRLSGERDKSNIFSDEAGFWSDQVSKPNVLFSFK
ncbi:MAG: hypothetical protein AAF903_06230 [Pseudomonadota bacterium]